MRWSGIVAIVAAGIVMDVFVVGGKIHRSGGSAILGAITTMNCMQPDPQIDVHRRRSRAFLSTEGHMSTIAKTHIVFVTEIISTVMETAIFAYLGMFLLNARYHWNFVLSSVAIFSCLGSRAIMIPVFSSIANWLEKIRRVSRKYQYKGTESNTTSSNEMERSLTIDKKMQLVLAFAGLRGAVSFALVENIPIYDSASGHGTRLKPELKSMTSACIVFTVFILGGSTFYLLEKLGIIGDKQDKQEQDENQMQSLIKRKVSDQENTGPCNEYIGERNAVN